VNTERDVGEGDKQVEFASLKRPSRIVNESRAADQTRRDSEAVTLDGESGNAAWRTTEEEFWILCSRSLRFLTSGLTFQSLMHHQFNNQQLYALPTLYLCVLYLSENKQRLVPLTA
jgi:hypothetical protein